MTTGGRAGGAWLMTAAAALGLIDAWIEYVRLGSGIDHTGGALLVIVSSALLVFAGVVLAFVAPGGWRILFVVLSILDILGTGLAAWFLHAWILLALMAVALVGWLILVFAPGRTSTLAGRPA